MKLEQKINLIPLNTNHLAQTFIWMQDKSLRDDFLLRKSVTRKQHQQWFSRYQKDLTQKIFAIIANEIHCGNCGFKNISLIDKKAEVWIYIGEKACRGKGIAKKAVALLVEYARTKLKLKKLYLHVADFNRPARWLYASLGFKAEGVFKKEFRLNSKTVSVLRMFRLLRRPPT